MAEQKENKNNNLQLITCFLIHYLISAFQQPYRTDRAGNMRLILQIGSVAHTCNPGYLEGGGAQVDCQSGKTFLRSHLNK
jgi:hypothetical protein